MYELNYKGSEVDEAVGKVLENGTKWDSKQDALTGQEGQVVGFNADGEPVAQDAPSGLPDGGTNGQVLTRSGTSAIWKDVPKELPELGSINQILSVGSDGAYWRSETKPVLYIDVTESSGVYSTDMTWYTINAAVLIGQLPVVRLLVSEGYREKFFLPYYLPVGSNNALFYHIEGLTIEEIMLNGTEGVTSPLAVTYWSGTALEEPEGGTTGQILTKTADGQAWQNPPASGMTQTEADARYLQLSGGVVNGSFFAELNGGSLALSEGGNVTFASANGSIGMSNNRISSVANPVNNNDAANKAYVDSLKPTSLTATLSSSGWSGNSQTITVNGVITDTSAQDIDISCADKASADAWAAGGVWCSNPTKANKLTFTCTTPPTANINLNIRLWEVG